MQPHNHPPYEETFRRIATILDVMATEQTEFQRTQAEFRRNQSEIQQTEAEFRRNQSEIQLAQAEFRRNQSEIQQTQAELQRGHAELQRSQTELHRTVKALAESTRENLDRLAAHFRERDEETTDKLNGLIDLMNRHVTEHGKE